MSSLMRCALALCALTALRPCSAMALQRAARLTAANSSKATLRKCVDSYADSLDSVRPHLGDGIRSHPLNPTAVSSRPIIFGVGHGDTGTTSTFQGIHDLGFNAAHSASYDQDNIPGDAYCSWFWYTSTLLAKPRERCIDAMRSFDYTTLPEEVDAIFDTPVPNIFIQLFLSFPNAKWILTTRPGKEWAAKRLLVHPIDPPAMQEPCGHALQNFTIEENAHLLEASDALVRCAVNPDRLFELQLATEDTQGLLRKMGEFAGAKDLPTVSADFPYADNENLTYRAQYGECNTLGSLKWLVTDNYTSTAT